MPRAPVFPHLPHMHMITVTALEECVYRGRLVPVGELLTLPATDAAVLRYHGKIALSTDTDATARAQRQRAEASDAPRRRYRRRDLAAEE